MGLFAAVLSGFSAGMTGGKNQYFEQMDKLIDNDIRGQEMEINKAKSVAELRHNALAQDIASGNTMQEAKARQRVLVYEGLKQQAMAQSAALEDPKARLAAEDAIQKIDAQQQQAKLQLIDHAKQQAAAQAGAARAEQERQFKQQLEIAKLNLEAAKVEDAATDTKGLATAMQSANIPEAEAKIQQLHRTNPQLFREEETTGKPRIPANQAIPGVGGAWNAIKGAAVDMAPSAFQPIVAPMAFNAQERSNRVAVQQAFEAFRKAVAGNKMQEENISRIEKAAMGSRTTEEIATFMEQGEAIVEAEKRNLISGYGPAAYEKMQRRSKSLPSRLTEGPKLPDINVVGKK